MKQLTTLLAIAGLIFTFSITSPAYVGSVSGSFNCTAPSSKYGQIQIKTKAQDNNEALEKASQICFEKLSTKNHGLSEDEGLEIIDVCANLACN